MNLAAEILVVILSIFLALFLMLGIVLAIYLIKLTKQIRKITLSADKTVGQMESLVSRIVKVTSPMFLAEMIVRLTKIFKADKEEKK